MVTVQLKVQVHVRSTLARREIRVKVCTQLVKIWRDTSENLQVVELEQHIYGMTDVGRGVTKDRRTIYIYLSRAVHYRLCGARSGSPQ